MTGRQGLEARYEVRKINDPTGKHADCDYFVLDPQHDPIARRCLLLYALHARRDHPALSDDLWAWLDRLGESAGAVLRQSIDPEGA